MNILDQLADYARLRVRNAKEILPPDRIKNLAETLPQGDFAFENALKKRISRLSANARRLLLPKG